VIEMEEADSLVSTNSVFRLRPEMRLGRSLVRFARSQPLGAFSGLLLVAMVLVALLARVIAPYNPIRPDYHAILASPSYSHPFGTDNLGRDVLSRIIYGTRIALIVALGSVGMASVIGVTIGMAGAHFRGIVDGLSQRAIEVIMAMPGLLLALTLVAAFGASLSNVVIALTVVFTPSITRIVRAAALSVEAQEFVAAANTVGAGPVRIMFIHVLPNIIAPYLIAATVLGGQAIIAEASLSFLGLGIAPPTASWGQMLSGPAISLAQKAPWLIVFPGLAISLVVYASNLLGDSIRDATDPHLRASKGK